LDYRYQAVDFCVSVGFTNVSPNPIGSETMSFYGVKIGNRGLVCENRAPLRIERIPDGYWPEIASHDEVFRIPGAAVVNERL
jgi:hypothetical protein